MERYADVVNGSQASYMYGANEVTQENVWQIIAKEMEGTGPIIRKADLIKRKKQKWFSAVKIKVGLLNRTTLTNMLSKSILENQAGRLLKQQLRYLSKTNGGIQYMCTCCSCTCSLQWKAYQVRKVFCEACLVA